MLEGVDGIMCDLDGVIYRGDQAIPGAAETIDALHAAGIHILFCTNNSRLTPQEYVEKLARMGVRVGVDEMLTSAMVTGETLAERGWAGKRVILIGDEGARMSLRDAGLELNDDPGDTSADLVVVGWDPRFHYDQMTRAARAVIGGATLIATNSDASFPAPDGLIPGAGAILASIEVASGARAEVMGKPHAPMMDAIERRLDGCRRIAAIGDRPETDLAGADAKGWLKILVLTGVTSEADAGRVSPRPDATVKSVSGLI